MSSSIYLPYMSFICRWKWKWSVHPYIYMITVSVSLQSPSSSLSSSVNDFVYLMSVSSCSQRFCSTKSLYPYNRPLFDPSFHIVVSFAPVLVEIWRMPTPMMGAKRKQIVTHACVRMKQQWLNGFRVINHIESFTYNTGRETEATAAVMPMTNTIPTTFPLCIFCFSVCLMMRKNSGKQRVLLFDSSSQWWFMRVSRLLSGQTTNINFIFTRS